jgi:hypothetical protein
MNIYQKLHKIQSQILGLGKDKSSNSYRYVTGSKVLEHIKPLMNEYGLILKQEVLTIDNERQDYLVAVNTPNQKTKSEILTKVMMKFTWVDCETGEKDENLFGANGQNDWEKGFGSALTYAERYFLLKYFHIATDEDDIDNPDRKKADPVKVSIPAPVASTFIPKSPDERLEKAELALNKVITDTKELVLKQKDFKSTPEGANFQSSASVADLVKSNDIDSVMAFYKFVTKK